MFYAICTNKQSDHTPFGYKILFIKKNIFVFKEEINTLPSKTRHIFYLVMNINEGVLPEW